MGSHILKALSLGAKACMGGRAYLYGLAAGGEEGAYKSLCLLKDEVQNNMTLLGCADIEQITSSHFRKL